MLTKVDLVIHNMYMREIGISDKQTAEDCLKIFIKTFNEDVNTYDYLQTFEDNKNN